MFKRKKSKDSLVPKEKRGYNKDLMLKDAFDTGFL